MAKKVRIWPPEQAGRVIRPRVKSGGGRVKHKSAAMGVADYEAADQLRADKAKYGSDAPNHYERNPRTGMAQPVWEGDLDSVQKRKRRYLHGEGFVDKSDYL